MMKVESAGSYELTDALATVNAEGEVALTLLSDCVISVENHHQLKLHLINESAKKITINCENYGDLTITLAALNNGELDFALQADLVETQAKVKVVSATVNSHDSSLVYQINHLKPLTYSDINNYGLALSDSDYNCQLISRIKPGCINSEAYQSSRILTAGAVEKIKVLPILEMADNEIKAKHACSIGRLGDEQKYYLALRGLDETAMIQLVAKGYLGNILVEIDVETLKTELAKQIANQVDSLCLM